MASPTKSESRRKNKENKLPDLNWRDATNNNKGPSKSPPKSKGISPKNFHGSGSSNRVRSRPGFDYVKGIHATSKDNALREQKKEHIKVQQVKRSAFKEVTSLRLWPLQDLAMKDYHNLLKVYLNQDTLDNSNDNGEAAKPDHQHGDSSSSCASTDKKRPMKDKHLSPSKSQLKQKYLDDFLTERDIPAHNVATASCDPARKFDPGLWSLEPRIFSVEKANGKRKYLVGHMGRLLDHVWRKTDKTGRYFYELILEKTPCRLYFDLEYSIPDNPNILASQLMEEFYKELVTELIIQFPDHAEGFDRTCILDMDSSTTQKFSRHWIVHLPSNALFKDCQQAGKFVKTFIQKLADDVATGILKDRCPCLQDYLFVNPKGTWKEGEADLPVSKKVCFVDLGVYTRNRLFRLLGSSKFGKSPDCALRLASTNKFPLPKGFGNDMFYVPAMPVKSESNDSSSDSEDDEDYLDQKGKENALERFKAQTDWSMHAQVLARSLIVPLNIYKIDYPLLPEIDTADGDTKPINQHFSAATSSDTTDARGALYSSSRPSHGASPYPYIDDFITQELAGRGGVQGSIRAWTLDYGPNADGKVPVSIAYHMSRNRWCEAIGRSHKSNNILWTVQFRTKQCIQTCFDPDCRSMNYRGTPVELPTEVALLLDDALFDEEIAKMDKNELMRQKQCTKEEDDSFETAMMKLNLGGTEIKQEATEINNSPVEVPSAASFDDSLSDDALLDAISQNPDLFS